MLKYLCPLQMFWGLNKESRDDVFRHSWRSPSEDFAQNNRAGTCKYGNPCSSCEYSYELCTSYHFLFEISGKLIWTRQWKKTFFINKECRFICILSYIFVIIKTFFQRKEDQCYFSGSVLYSIAPGGSVVGVSVLLMATVT